MQNMCLDATMVGKFAPSVIIYSFDCLQIRCCCLDHVYLNVIASECLQADVSFTCIDPT